MYKPLMPVVAKEGFLLLDSWKNPIFVNEAAVQILIYPQETNGVTQITERVRERIQALLLPVKMPASGVVPRFQSGRRVYRCRSFHLDGNVESGLKPAMAVLLERSSTGTLSMAQLADKFNLTVREQEVAQYILYGLTSKEIALKMGISPNTVKAFLRLIMMKMGVSTRSGIAGKVFTSEFRFGGNSP